MIQTDQEPVCKAGGQHVYFVLGIEDSGEEVARCGNCLTLKYTQGQQVRFEVPST